jgi:hypothetical protein
VYWSLTSSPDGAHGHIFIPHYWHLQVDSDDDV